MDFFNYRNGELFCEGVPAERIAREVGTPAYVYSRATFVHHYRQIAEARHKTDEHAGGPTHPGPCRE